MEIDFLGLNSTTKFDNMEKRNSKDAIFPTETGGVETSLSLRPSLSCHSESISEKNKWAQVYSSSSSLTEQPGLFLMPPPAFRTAGFLYNLDDKLTELRKMSEIPVELYSAACANDNLPERADSSKYIAGLSHHTRNGYTPTVAMARRATLARFLEQRLHRMNKARTAHLTGKSMKGNNILKR